jgi:aryl-alcohol dehydrogenase-like predicted oxidoreductase
MTTLDSYRTLGHSGLRVSPLSLGTMTFGEDSGWGADVPTSEMILGQYLDRGGNVIDTANIYANGHSEKIIGDFLARSPGLRDRLVLSTKFFASLHPGDPNGGGAGRKAVVAQLEQSLRRLGTDYIDIYWLHGWDRRAPIEETLRTLDDLVGSGKIRYIGFSNVPAWVVAHAQATAHFRGWAPISALQIEYSLLERTPEGELLPMAEDLGLGVVPWSPLRGGMLAGTHPQSARAQVMPGPTEHDRVVIDAVAGVAAELGVRSAEVALAWVRSRSAIASTLIGARTLDQLQANLASLDVSLTASQLSALDESSTPTLGFPAAITAGPGPMLGFGGSTVDGVTHPTWPMLVNSPTRY